MFAGLSTFEARTLEADDRAGISALYDTWVQLPGAAKDIAVGPDGTAWAVGTLPVTGGFSIHRWNGSSWDMVPGGAKRITVDASNRPWVVNSDGAIFRRTTNTTAGSWDAITGCAQDIGAASTANGGVWIIGCEPVTGGFTIKFFQNNSWTLVDGGGVRIAVGATLPWVANDAGLMYRRSSSKTWIALPPFQAKDLAVDSNDILYIVNGLDPKYGGYRIWIREEQSAITKTDPAASTPGADAIVPYGPSDGAAVAIAAGPNGPIMINSFDQIFRTAK
jgi:hypothetical protein